MARWDGITLEQRYWDKVDQRSDDECWNWTACLCGSGYGSFKVDGTPVKAHRMSWVLHHGDIPTGMWVLHRCDNRRCVNPAHLFLGDNEDNMRDMAEKGRWVSRIGMSHWKAKLTPEQVAEIRQRFTGAYGEYTRLGREYGVTDVHIRRIVDGMSRRAA